MVSARGAARWRIAKGMALRLELSLVLWLHFVVAGRINNDSGALPC